MASPSSQLPLVVWVCSGAALIVAEILTGTAVFLCLGLGALMAALMAAIGIRSVAWQCVFFGVTCGFAAIFLRKRFRWDRKRPPAGR